MRKGNLKHTYMSNSEHTVAQQANVKTVPVGAGADAAFGSLKDDSLCPQ